MRSFFDWYASSKDKKPWVIFGKGPSFSRHIQFPNLDETYFTMGLNHICRERKVFMAHVIDANVLQEVPRMEDRTTYLVMPMHPHFEFKPTKKTLEDVVRDHPVARKFDEKGTLLWYNASTWHGAPHEGSPLVEVAYFSAEAAVRLLALAGVRKIRTLGIDGGTKYSDEFKDIRPFRGGHTSFDIQKKPIEATIRKFGVDFGPLG